MAKRSHWSLVLGNVFIKLLSEIYKVQSVKSSEIFVLILVAFKTRLCVKGGNRVEPEFIKLGSIQSLLTTIDEFTQDSNYLARQKND